MVIVKKLVFTFCLASLSAGVILHLFTDSAAKRCIKAIAGLYILSAVLGVARDVPILVQALEGEISAIQVTQKTLYDSNEAAFTEPLLAQIRTNLEKKYNDYLAVLGYDATVDIVLVRQAECVAVQSVFITTSALTTQQQTELKTYFCTQLAIDSVSFVWIEETVE